MNFYCIFYWTFLFAEEDLEKSETAKSTMSEWDDTKKFVEEVIAEIEKEANSISTVCTNNAVIFLLWQAVVSVWRMLSYS